MQDIGGQSRDLLGIRPFAQAAADITQAMAKGAQEFLGRICLPAASELGLLLQDRVRYWRTVNVVRLALKAEEKVRNYVADAAVQAHPRLVGRILDAGSWVDDEQVADMWAGLLASSCTNGGRDDDNLMFIDLLSRLTTSQARVLDYACRTAKKHVTQGGWIAADTLYVSGADLQQVSGIHDVQRLDRELDFLRSLELIEKGFDPRSTNADITPPALALQMFVRCQGFRGSPLEFFGLAVLPPPAPSG